MKDCYQKLMSLREENQLSYQQMADKIGISKCYYWQLEHKKRRLYYDLAKKIALVFEMKPDEIFFDEVKKTVK